MSHLKIKCIENQGSNYSNSELSEKVKDVAESMLYQYNVRQ